MVGRMVGMDRVFDCVDCAILDSEDLDVEVPVMTIIIWRLPLRRQEVKRE